VSDDCRQTLAVTLPVAEVVGRSWDWLDPHLDAALRLSTDLANWCVAELYVREPRPFPAAGPMPPPPPLGPGGLYRHAFGNLRDGQPARYPGTAAFRATAGVMPSASCVVRAVERKYRQVRFDLLRRHAVNLLRFRSFPFPVHNQQWQAGYADGSFPVVALTLPGAGPVTLRLKRRADFGRQLARFRQLHDGTARKGEAALYRDRDGQLLGKLVGHCPRADRGPAPRG